MDGLQLARAVSNLWPRARLVVTSGHGIRRPDLPDEAVFIAKPWRALGRPRPRRSAAREPPRRSPDLGSGPRLSGWRRIVSPRRRFHLARVSRDRRRGLVRTMRIRTGFDIAYAIGQPTPMILELSVHPTRMPDVITPQSCASIRLSPPTSIGTISAISAIGSSRRRDSHRLGGFSTSTIRACPIPVVPEARQIPVQDLPDEVLIYLLGSRYCDTTSSRPPPGTCSGRRPRAGAGCRPSSTTPTTASASTT